MSATDPNAQSALRHAPLTADMVPLLTAGSSVLVPNGPNAGGVMLTFLCVGNSPGYIRFRDDKSNEAHGPQGYFTYIGERGPDGWITAPEGGWTENPVPGMRVEVRGDAFVCTDFPSELFNWNQTAIAACVTAFRPAEALSAHPPATGSGEAVAWQRRHGCNTQWLDCEEADVAFYRERGQEVRALYAAPVSGRGDLAVAIKALERIRDGAGGYVHEVFQRVAAEALRTLTEKEA